MSRPFASATRRARAALAACVEPANPRVCSAVQDRGPIEVEAALREGDEALDPRGSIRRRLQAVDPDEVLERGRAAGIRFVNPGDGEWPDGLEGLRHVQHTDMSGEPFGLWLKGPLQLDELVRRRVAMVGSRAATAYGVTVATDLSAGLAGRGVVVVSGAAYGIDAAAHRGALSGGGLTCGVLACGLDSFYPRGNSALIERIARDGLLVSELAPGLSVSRPRLLARNRLVAALGGAVVVVEAAARSGALSTAAWADHLSLPLLGVPGPVTSAMSSGVHRLLRRGALVVTDAAEIVEATVPFGQDMLPLPVRSPTRPADRLSPDAAQVYEAVPAGRGIPLDDIVTETGLDADAVLGGICELHAQGLVEQVSGRWRVSRDAVRLART